MDQLHSSTLLQPPSRRTTTPTPATKLHDPPSTNNMDHAKTPNGDSNTSPTMQAINATIDKLKNKLLPPIPHLLSVPTSDPYRGSRPWETHRNSPFEAYEYDELQYMTLVPGDNRGVARPRGGWEDEINSRSPYNVSRSRSGTATPQQGERGAAKPRSRISLADYKSGKRVPKPSTESQQPAGESTREKENVKVTTKPEPEPAKPAQNGAVHSSDTRHSRDGRNEDAPRPSDSRPSQSKPAPSQTKENDRHAPLPLKARDQHNTTPKPTLMKQEPLHPLPKKPAEPIHAPKRPLEKPEQSQPEKRLKVEAKHTPSGAAKGHTRNTSDSLSRLFGTAAKPKPSNPKQSQPTSVDNTPTKRAEDKKALERGPASGSKAKDTPPVTRVPEMPKLLSPLPEYLTSPTPVSFSSGVDKPGKNGRDSPSTMKAESSGTKRKEPSEKTSPFRLPELLPRELPPNVEELLAKSKQPTRKHDTVQARHERSRNPDAPGVARKAPKLSAAERRRASKASDSSPPEITYEPPRQIVKLKYKKSMSKDIQRILKMKPVPNRALLELADGIVPGKPAVSKARAAEGKRPRPVPDEQPERAIKRAKVPAKIDSDKATTSQLLPPFKSPGLAPTSGKKLPSASKVTPKKGDAMKSVATRRVDSADDNTLTPKTVAASTPASTEKPRQNGSEPKAVDVERCRAANIKYSEMGKTLKRKRDVYIHSKENQLATLAGAESLLAYLVAFDAFDTMYRKAGRPNTGDNWLSLFPLLQANHDLGKLHPHLDIVILLIGGVATNSLLAVHNQRFAKEIPSNSPDYLRFRDAMSENIRRNKEFWMQYQMACEELASREPEAVREGGGMAFVRTPGGQALPVKTVKVEAARMLREYVKRHKLEWEMQVDF